MKCSIAVRKIEDSLRDGEGVRGVERWSGQEVRGCQAGYSLVLERGRDRKRWG